jgi:hypothetical protein
MQGSQATHKNKQSETRRLRPHGFFEIGVARKCHTTTRALGVALGVVDRAAQQSEKIQQKEKEERRGEERRGEERRGEERRGEERRGEERRGEDLLGAMETFTTRRIREQHAAWRRLWQPSQTNRIDFKTMAKCVFL